MAGFGEECMHGSLARSCETCAYELEIATLKAKVAQLRHELYHIQCNATNLVTMVEDGEADWTDVIERLEAIIQIALTANRSALRGEEVDDG